MKVALIFGGRSPEHEVSIVTAHQVNTALAENYDVIPIYITKTGEWLTGDSLNDLSTFTNGTLPRASDFNKVTVEFKGTPKFVAAPSRPGWRRKKTELPVDVAFPAIHGVHGEDGSLQGLLELMNIPYIGAGVLGSSVGMDKIMMKAALSENGLPILPYLPVTKHGWNTADAAILEEVESRLSYPMFVKPAVSGSSIGVSQATDTDTLRQAIELACRYCHRVLVEQGIENASEINCAVMGTHTPTASVCEKPISSNNFLSFDDKYIHQREETTDSPTATEDTGGVSSGMAGAQREIPAPISEELTLHIQRLATATFQAINCAGVARIDFLLDSDEEVYVNEINTIPGSFSFYLWDPMGISFPELVSQLIELAVETHEQKNRLIYSYTTNLLNQVEANLGKLG